MSTGGGGGDGSGGHPHLTDLSKLDWLVLDEVSSRTAVFLEALECALILDFFFSSSPLSVSLSSALSAPAIPVFFSG